ncbi:MAG: hypothetical protein HY886_07095 [Deltaproteobacteria bacterium]|nr:hypothetical protein [Deltaproteobacteria bacterium]
MDNMTIFAVGALITLGSGAMVIRYLSAGLEKIICELCGTKERALFWSKFVNTLLLVMPVVFVMYALPTGADKEKGFFEVVRVARVGLVGLILMASAVAVTLNRYIMMGTNRAGTANNPMEDAQVVENQR